MATKKQLTGSCPCGKRHPAPTTDERVEFHGKLHDAIAAIDKAWGYANRTPAYHDLTERISEAMNDLSIIQRTI
jgi:cob(I)alamin adenosyltransferase